MAQLSDDCFAVGGSVMTLDEAVALVGSRLKPVSGTQRVPLAGADRRVLARDVVAPMSLPPFTNSAVDGYAVGGADLPVTGERALPVAGRLQAGASHDPVEPGHAVRIFTGAPMPQGTDTVFMQEDVRHDQAGRVVLPVGLPHGANVRSAGEDVAAGAVVLRVGHILRPQDVALLAALGFTDVEVRSPVRVAVFSTGNEIVAPGAARGPTQLFDANRFMLHAMLARLGCAVNDLGILPDDSRRIADVLAQAAGAHDLLLTSGGVSTGEADYVRASVESVGSLVFWRVAVKPGRPVAMGVIRGAAFIGLPGNPVASFVTFAGIARPTILALAGAQVRPLPAIPLRAAFSYTKKPARREYVRASLRRGADGVWEAVKFPRQGASLLSSLVDTEGLVELDEDTTAVRPGDMVRFLPYSSLW